MTATARDEQRERYADLEAENRKLRADVDRTHALHEAGLTRIQQLVLRVDTLTHQRAGLLNALQAVIHGDGVFYSLSPTPRELALDAVAACARSKSD